MKKKLLLHAWTIQKKLDEYFLPYTHWIYLNEILNYYDEVELLSITCIIEKDAEPVGLSIKNFYNVKVYELPFSKSYAGAIFHFFSYYSAYKKITGITTYYSRYPVPFGWLQKLVGKSNNRIIHYVGDPVDVIFKNPNFSTIKKYFLIIAFKFENALYHWACKGANVYSNGFSLAQKLLLKNITAVPLISSTLIQDDFYFLKNKKCDFEALRFVYLGYLRKAKGIEIIIRAFGKFQAMHPQSSLTIIGSGEMEKDLVSITSKECYQNVFFKGHIDNRELINEALRNHDVFLFGSQSEGSPRVILEAMANGLVVISTPVGSLPTVFVNNKEILFIEYNSIEDFNVKMNRLVSEPNLYFTLRKNSFNKVKLFTLKNFIYNIFYNA